MKSVWPAVSALLVFSACSKDLHNKEAVRQGIIDHLSSRKNLDLDMSAMEVVVNAVAFRQDVAEATISFQPKGSGGGASGMQMKYTLERKGNQWAVKAKASTGENPHGAAAADPHGGAPGAGGGLPAGHPPLNPPSGRNK